jgi:transposase
MITIGVDAHKRVHAAVAIDTAGQQVAAWRGTNTPAGWQEVHRWATSQDPETQWGIEGAGQYGHGLAQQLVAAGETVVEVNPRLTAGMRRGSRERGKSDRLDALAVARVVAQEHEALPTVQTDGTAAVLAELSADRASALAEATRLRNQLHQVLHQLGMTPLPDLTAVEAVATLTTYQAAAGADVLSATRAGRVRHLSTRLALALRQAAESRAAIEAIAHPHLAPLEAICGVAALSAGLLAADLGSHHFATGAALGSMITGVVLDGAGVRTAQLLGLIGGLAAAVAVVVWAPYLRPQPPEDLVDPMSELLAPQPD